MDKEKHIRKERGSLTLLYENYETQKHLEYGHRFLQPLISKFLQQQHVNEDGNLNTVQIHATEKSRSINFMPIIQNMSVIGKIETFEKHRSD